MTEVRISVRSTKVDVTGRPRRVQVTALRPGPDGLSAYQVAIKAGFEGTVEQWLASLEGEQGSPGPPGITRITQAAYDALEDKTGLYVVT